MKAKITRAWLNIFSVFSISQSVVVEKPPLTVTQTSMDLAVAGQ